MTPKDEELMTRDDIIEIGRSIDPRAWLGIDKEDVDWCVTFAQLATKKAVEAEREACAKVCDEQVNAWQQAAWGRSAVEAHAIRQCADAIRARGDE